MEVDFDGQAFNIDMEKPYLKECKTSDIFGMVAVHKYNEADKIAEEIDMFQDADVNALPLLEQYHLNFCKIRSPFLDFKEKCSCLDEMHNFSAHIRSTCPGNNFVCNLASHQNNICNPLPSNCLDGSKKHLTSPLPVLCNDRSDRPVLSSVDQTFLQNLELNTLQVSSTASGDLSHSKKSNHIRRPMNAFMVWSRLERKKLAKSMPHVRNPDLSKILGDTWKNMSVQERIPFIKEAERIKLLHSATFPGYKYKPKKRKSRNKKIDTGKQIGEDETNIEKLSSSSSDNVVGDSTVKTNFVYEIDDFLNSFEKCDDLLNLGNVYVGNFTDNVLQAIQSDNDQIERMESSTEYSFASPSCLYSEVKTNYDNISSLDLESLKNPIPTAPIGLENSFQFKSLTSMKHNNIGKVEHISYQTYHPSTHKVCCDSVPNKLPSYRVSTNPFLCNSYPNNEKWLFQNPNFPFTANFRHRENNLTLKDLVISNKPLSRNRGISINVNLNEHSTNDWISFLDGLPPSTDGTMMQTYDTESTSIVDQMTNENDESFNIGSFQNAKSTFESNNISPCTNDNEQDRFMELLEEDENIFRKNIILRSASKDSGVDEMINYSSSSSRRSSVESLDDILMREQNDGARTIHGLDESTNEIKTLAIGDQLADQSSNNEINKSNKDSSHNLTSTDAFLTNYSMFDYSACPYYIPMNCSINESDCIS